MVRPSYFSQWPRNSLHYNSANLLKLIAECEVSEEEYLLSVKIIKMHVFQSVQSICTAFKQH